MSNNDSNNNEVEYGVAENGTVGVMDEPHANPKRLHSSQTAGMDSSVLKFKDINFVVGRDDKKKNILTDVSGSLPTGHVLASK